MADTPTEQAADNTTQRLHRSLTEDYNPDTGEYVFEYHSELHSIRVVSMVANQGSRGKTAAMLRKLTHWIDNTAGPHSGHPDDPWAADAPPF